MTISDLKKGYGVMFASREIDRLEQQYVDSGSAFFSVSGAGHEASSALAPYLNSSDWIRGHYRDKALLFARGLPAEEFFRSLFCKETSHSRGRQMSAHFASKELGILSIPGPMGNNVLQDVGIAAAIQARKEGAIVVSSVGDGTTQQGEVLEGFCEAARSRLPVLFLIHDNKLAISVRTEGKTIFSSKDSSVLGLPVRYVDGSDYEACAAVFEETVAEIRETGHPRVVVMECERLCDHTNADDQSVYRSSEEVAESARHDPIARLRGAMLAKGASEDEIAQLENEIRAKIKAAAKSILDDPPGTFVASVLPEFSEKPSTKVPWPESAASVNTFMGGSLNRILDHFLKTNADVFLYGQDLEDPKGDVFGVTKGLSTNYPGRVVNAPLTESTIMGACMGRAMAGQKPVAFIQFADFLPLALNQVISELSTMAWRTAGQFTCPMVVIISAGGYRPGLGPFHAQTMESYLCHTPGIAVVSPSNAKDAAGLLISAMESEIPTFFVYPKCLLNDPIAARSFGKEVEAVPIGKCAIAREGADITLVGWGNAVPYLMRVATSLEAVDLSAEIIDLRSLSPWDREAVQKSASKTGRLLVVHEDNETCGLAGEIIASVTTATPSRPPAAARVCRPDVPIPCSYTAQLKTLPSHDSILEAACQLLNVELVWEYPELSDDGLFDIKAVGTSPADSQVQLLEWQVRQGDLIEEGDLLVEIEADKAAFEFTAPVAGVLVELVVPSFTQCAVGDCIAKISLASDRPKIAAPTELPKRVPRLRRLELVEKPKITAPVQQNVRSFIFTLEAGVGSRRVSNEEIGKLAGMEPAEILSTTGIERRQWYESEAELDSAIIECLNRMIDEDPEIADRLGMVIVSTGTNSQSMPSRACRLVDGVSRKHSLKDPGAYDFYTACSGYIYGLEQADAYLRINPDRYVFLVTAEILSQFLNKEDRTTAILFGDGFSASLIGTAQANASGKAPLFEIRSTSCFAKPDPGNHLTLSQGESIVMDGGEIFLEASRSMPKALQAACEKIGIGLPDLDIVVPHQANQRIIEAISRRLKKHKVDVFSNVHQYGNTSSTTIPLGLREILDSKSEKMPRMFGLTAFGGGYTYAGAVLERVANT